MPDTSGSGCRYQRNGEKGRSHPSASTEGASALITYENTAKAPVTPSASPRCPVAQPTASAIAPNARPTSSSITHAAPRSTAGTVRSKGGPTTDSVTNSTAARAVAVTTIAPILSTRSCRRRIGVESSRSSVPSSSSPAIARAPAPIAKTRNRIGPEEAEGLAPEVAGRAS